MGRSSWAAVVVSLSLCATVGAAEPFVSRNLKLTPPKGWVQPDEAKRIWTPQGRRDTTLICLSPVPAAGSIDRQLVRLIKSKSYAQGRFAKVGIAPVRSTTLLPSKLRVASTNQAIPLQGGKRLLVLHLLVASHGNVYPVLFMSSDAARAQQFLKQELPALLKSLRPHVGALKPPKPPEKTQTLRLFCATLSFPAAWRRVKTKSGEAHFKAPLGIEGTKDRWRQALVQVSLSKPTRPQALLSEWCRGKLFNHQFGRVKWRPTFRTFWAMAWKLESGATGYSVKLIAYKGGKFHAYLGGNLVVHQGVTVLTGLPMVYDKLPKARWDQASKRFDALVLDLFGVVSRVEVHVPERRPNWERFLIAKKTYRRFYQWEHGSMAGFYVLKEYKERWWFFPDNACVYKSNSYLGFTNKSYHDYSDPHRVTAWSHGRLTDTKKNKRSYFEVRGKDGDLWLVAYHPDGFSTVHRLEPDKQDKWSHYRPRGLAIDGWVEGNWYDSNGLKRYKKN